MKKFVSILIAIIIVIVSLPISSIAAEIMNVIPSAISEEYIYNEDGSYYTKLVDESGNEISYEEPYEEEYLETNSFRAKSVTVPQKWDSRDKGWVTPVKNQAPFGTCWAFAFCATAESSLIAQGYETADSIDLSESHLVYFRDHNYIANSQNPVQQDKYTLSQNGFSYGGHDYDAIATASRWSGLTMEDKFPYKSSLDEMTYSESDMFEHDYELVSTKIFDATETAAVKENIMTYGAAEMTMYYSNSYLVRNGLNRYYYCNANLKSSSGATLVNHAVTVVGWNDDIPATSFKNTPSGNGAWLIKNSYGSNSSNNGYFWMSYYDTNIYSFTGVVAKPAGDYDHNYQYNGVTTTYGMTNNKNSLTIANVFTAESNETVDACSFEVNQNPPYDCTITVYGNISNVLHLNNSTVGATATVKCDQKGFYTVKFDKPYEVKKGEKFAIAVQFNAPSSNKVYVAVEPSQTSSTHQCKCEKGQSLYDGGYYWVDNADTKYFGNYTIKAYTSDVIQYNNDAIYANEGTTTVIDNTNKTISGLNPGKVELSDYIIANNNYYYKYDGFGTGTQVKIYNKKDELVDTYELLIYGDVNGDGWYDGNDAVLVNAIYTGMLTQEQIGITKWLAADCNHDGVIDETDYNVLINCGLLLDNINQASSQLQTNSLYQEYVKLIDQVDNPDNESKNENLIQSIFNKITKLIYTVLSWLKLV